MELNLTDSDSDQFVVWKLADSNPEAEPNVVGANANVYCTILMSQFLGQVGAVTVHA